MTNTAKILNFGRGNFAEQELRVADIDDGYTRLLRRTDERSE